MSEPEEVRCECWAHCAITRRQERERAAKIAEAMVILGHSVQEPSCLEIAKKIREGK